MDDDEIIEFEWELEACLVGVIEDISAREAYKLCEKHVLIEQAKHKAAREAQRLFLYQCKEHAIAFQQKYLIWFPTTEFIDKPHWKSHEMAIQLEEALKYTDIKTREALKTVGLEGHFSNTVNAEIKKILKNSYRDSLH